MGWDMGSANMLTQNDNRAGSTGFPRRADTAFCRGRSARGLTRANESHMDRQTLSIMKACEAVGVSRRTIYNWIAAGKVEYVRTAGGSIRIFADTLWRDAAPSVGAASASAASSVGHA